MEGDKVFCHGQLFWAKVWWRVGGTDRMTDRRTDTSPHITAVFFSSHKLPKTLLVTTLLLFGPVTLLRGTFLFYFIKWSQFLVPWDSTQNHLKLETVVHTETCLYHSISDQAVALDRWTMFWADREQDNNWLRRGGRCFPDVELLVWRSRPNYDYIFVAAAYIHPVANS